MVTTSTLALLAGLLSSTFAAPTTRYNLIDTYDASNWLSMFDVQAIDDPTHGFVTYVDAKKATSSGYIRTANDQIYMGVDNTTVLDPKGAGRSSVRLSSKAAYNHALVIADFEHMPATECGVWPAFWMFGGPEWPASGEIDIVEGVNLMDRNQMTLHTSAGCSVTVGEGGQTGQLGNGDCNAESGGPGCGVTSSDSASYGDGFNAAGGQIYAMLWTSSGIKIWNWSHGSAPKDIKFGNPNPNGWGKPAANFGGCDFDKYFKNQNLIFDTTFCGDWAGNVWGTSQCASKNMKCEEWVAGNPSAFTDAYWLVNGVKVYSV